MIRIRIKKPKINFNKFRLKSAKFSDIKAVTKLFGRIKRIKPEDVREMIEEKKVFVLKDGKKRVRAAFAYTIFTLAGLTTIIYINKLSIHPNMEGKGIGSFLLNEIKRKTLKLGAAFFFLHAYKKVQKFYQKNHMKKIWQFFWWKNKST